MNPHFFTAPFLLWVQGSGCQVQGCGAAHKKIEAPRMLMALRGYRYYRESRWEV